MGSGAAAGRGVRGRMVAVAACALCCVGALAGDADVVLAQGEGLRITARDFAQAAAMQSPVYRKTLQADRGQRQAFLDQLIHLELLAAEARARGFDKDEEVVSVRRNRLATLMRRELAAGFSFEEPDEQVLRAFYDTHRDRYHKPEYVRLRHILVRDRGAAQALLDALRKGGKVRQYDFRRLAAERSQDEESRLRGGDLGFATRSGQREDGGNIDKKLAQAAFSVGQNGAIYPELVHTDAGYHIVMRTGHRRAVSLSFEQVRGQIARHMRAERFAAFMKRQREALYAKYRVSINEDNLKHVLVDFSQPIP